MATRLVLSMAILACLPGVAAPAGVAAPDEAAPPATRPSAPTTRAAAPTTRPSATPRNDIPGLPNFAKVSDSLYRGAQPTPEGFRRLREMGVKTVVNLRSFSSDRPYLSTGLRYTHIYCKAWHPEDEDTLKFLKVMSDPANHPVFVHCQRAPTAPAARSPSTAWSSRAGPWNRP